MCTGHNGERSAEEASTRCAGACCARCFLPLLSGREHLSSPRAPGSVHMLVTGVCSKARLVTQSAWPASQRCACGRLHAVLARDRAFQQCRGEPGASPSAAEAEAAAMRSAMTRTFSVRRLPRECEAVRSGCLGVGSSLVSPLPQDCAVASPVASHRLCTTPCSALVSLPQLLYLQVHSDHVFLDVSAPLHSLRAGFTGRQLHPQP